MHSPTASTPAQAWRRQLACSCGTSSPRLPHQHLQAAQRQSAAFSCQATSRPSLVADMELDDEFSALDDGTGMMTVAGFGSLLSERSARTTFPNLTAFRVGKVRGYRRVFAHIADIFYERGIAKPDTKEVSSLSCEPCKGAAELVVALFEVPFSPASVAAFIQREHEFRFTAVQPFSPHGAPEPRLAVLCTRFTDEEYIARRCPPVQFAARWGRHGIDRIWRDDILPCRVYCRHCVLAARSLSEEAYHNFLDHTFLGDRRTTLRQYLASNPSIMEELLPPDLIGRYSG